MIFRFLILLFLFLFSQAELNAQLNAQLLKDLPVHERTELTIPGLRHQLDSLQDYARIEVRAVFRDIDLNINDAYHSRSGKREQFIWRFEHQGIASRVFASIENLGPADTLYLINWQNEVVEIVHKGNLQGTRFTFKPLDDQQYVHLSRSSGSNVEFKLYGMSLEFPGEDKKTKSFDFGDSGKCHVNVNCAEGNDYADIKNSVVRILVKLGPSLGFCTGSVINTTNYSFAPYLLTAEHCGIISEGNYVSPSDLNSWTFYFNYQAEGCASPASEGNLAQQQITGAQLIANSNDNGGDLGSDFFLLYLNSPIPESYNAYYTGWNRKGDDVPKRGATIHHPNGDIKKISSYNDPATTGSFDGRVSGTHWLVRWNSTANGYGTTEAGSSGCPIYDENGLLRGVLTGGAASCSSVNGQDYFGKFSYSWAGNGNIPSRRLRDWLDPTNTGFLAVNGAYPGDSIPNAGNDLLIVNNPVKDGVLSIENLGTPTDDLQVLVTDYSGRVVFNQKTVAIPGVNEEIETRSWRNGLYIVVVLRNDDIITRKVFIRN